jgi:hypothetical protein
MGDFTAHCAVSGLPLWGRSVVMVGLVESGYKEFREGAVTVTDLFKLAGLPIYGKYNDYGFIDEIDTPFSERVTIEAWTDKPDATLESLFYRDDDNKSPVLSNPDWFGTGQEWKTGVALIDCDVWHWLLENSEVKHSTIFDLFKEKWPAKLQEYKEESEAVNRPLELTLHYSLGTNYDYKDKFGQFLRAISSMELLAHPLSRRIKKAMIDMDMQVMSDMIELYCATFALRDLDKFWQPSSTCGDQYGDVTRMKVRFAKFHYDNIKAMRKKQQRDAAE